MTDRIQRVLHTTPAVHIYQIPPLTSTKGFNAGPWTAPPRPLAKQIFTARLRILETSSTSPVGIKVDILLEDPASGDLFAAAPYVSPVVVQQALDSSRFFAVRVEGEGGRKAMLGLGFEERSEAFDFSVALGEARKVLGVDAGGKDLGAGRSREKGLGAEEVKRDFSLKEGESIHVELGGKGRRIREWGEQADSGAESKALFSIAPPPSGGGVMPVLAPPPSAKEVKGAREMGFDDGEFGEFQ